jgi:hypothetical protein
MFPMPFQVRLRVRDPRRVVTLGNWLYGVDEELELLDAVDAARYVVLVEPGLPKPHS